MTVFIKARAKINLFFHITGKRPDGYHLMESMVVFAEDIYDSITITPAEVNSTSVVEGEFSHLLGGENLIDKALSAFGSNQKYHCDLDKNIPIGAGLGGGSSDAAMVAQFLNNNASIAALVTIGADLPICYHNKPAFCSGIGEIIEPITDFPNIYMVLVNPRQPMLSADVFRHNRMSSTPSIHSKPSGFAKAMDLVKFLSPLANDLTAASVALMPEVQTILNLISAQPGCHISRMSGSGPTCFGIFTELTAAVQASQNISNYCPEFWVKHTMVTG